MEREFIEYFNPQHEYYLNNIDYHRIENTPNQRELSLSCEDNINTTIMADGVKLLITRTLRFAPEGIFYLSISFGADLKFSELGRTVDWSAVDVSEEFKSHGEFVTVNLLSRISLLIGQITSSFGQQPIILPGVVGQ